MDSQAEHHPQALVGDTTGCRRFPIFEITSAERRFRMLEPVVLGGRRRPCLFRTFPFGHFNDEQLYVGSVA